MTEQRTAQYRRDDEKPPSGWAAGFTVFAGVMMIMAGGFQALAGLVAIFENEFYATTRNYILEFDVTTWGWIHLLLGLLVLFAGFAVLSGKTWGRVIGIILASVSALGARVSNASVGVCQSLVSHGQREDVSTVRSRSDLAVAAVVGRLAAGGASGPVRGGVGR
jgi:hypothetical protein